MASWKKERAAGTPLVALATPDVPATARELTRATGDAPVVAWSCSQGLVAMNDAGGDAVARMTTALGGAGPEAITALGDALVAARGLPEGAVLLALNAHMAWSQPLARDAAQALRDLFKQDQRTLVFVAPEVSDVPRELAPDVRFLREEMPSAEERAGIIERTYSDAAASNKGMPKLEPETLARARDATAGLTGFAVEQATAVAITRSGLQVPTLRATARAAINARRGLRVSDEKVTFASVGGLDAGADYVRAIFKGPDRPSAVVRLDEVEKMLAGSGPGGDTSGVAADIFGALLTWIEVNKVHGILLMGPPGSGKSLLAQAAAGEHDVPLIEMDIGAMKGSLVGESGANLRAALDTIKAVSEGKVLLIATCNGVAELRPELLRRFKPRFMVDLPGQDALEEIWKIQLASHGLDAKSPRPDDAGWTGAEVRDACKIARATSSTPRDAARFIVPISTSSAEVINRVRIEATGKFICATRGGPYKGPASSATRAPAKGRKLALEDK